MPIVKAIVIIGTAVFRLVAVLSSMTAKERHLSWGLREGRGIHHMAQSLTDIAEG